MEVVEHIEPLGCEHSRAQFLFAWFELTGSIIPTDNSVRAFWHARGYSFQQAG